MAEGFTNARANKILLDNIKSTTYVCMSTTTPDKDGGNFSEPASTTGYARRTFGTVNASKTAQVTNGEIIFLFEAEQDCGSFTHIGLSDSKDRGGTVFLTAKLANAVTVTAGYVPLIRKNALIIGLDKETLEPYA